MEIKLTKETGGTTAELSRVLFYKFWYMQHQKVSVNIEPTSHTNHYTLYGSTTCQNCLRRDCPNQAYLGLTHLGLKLLNFMIHLCFPLKTFNLLNILRLQ